MNRLPSQGTGKGLVSGGSAATVNSVMFKIVILIFATKNEGGQGSR